MSAEIHAGKPGCPSSNDLMAYHDDELDAETAARIEEHVRDCVECTRWLESQSRIEGVYRQSYSEPHDRAFDSFRWRLEKRLGRSRRRRTSRFLDRFRPGVLIPAAAAVLAVLIGLRLLLPPGESLLDEVTGTAGESEAPGEISRHSTADVPFVCDTVAVEPGVDQGAVMGDGEAVEYTWEPDRTVEELLVQPEQIEGLDDSELSGEPVSEHQAASDRMISSSDDTLGLVTDSYDITISVSEPDSSVITGGLGGGGSAEGSGLGADEIEEGWEEDVHFNRDQEVVCDEISEEAYREEDLDETADWVDARGMVLEEVEQVAETEGTLTPDSPDAGSDDAVPAEQDGHLANGTAGRPDDETATTTSGEASVPGAGAFEAGEEREEELARTRDVLEEELEELASEADFYSYGQAAGSPVTLATAAEPPATDSTASPATTLTIYFDDAGAPHEADELEAWLDSNASGWVEELAGYAVDTLLVFSAEDLLSIIYDQDSAVGAEAAETLQGTY